MGAVSIFTAGNYHGQPQVLLLLMFLCNCSDFSRSIEGLWDFLRLRHNCDSFGV